MKNDGKERIHKQLERRLDRLPCLTWATRHRVLEHARERLTASKIAAYIQEHVAFLERWIAPVDHPAFLEVCRGLGPIRTRDELKRRLGVCLVTGSDWSGAALRFKQDGPRCLFCASNAWVLQFEEPATNERAINLWIFGNALGSMGLSAAAVAILEKHLGLTESSYADPMSLDHHLRATTGGFGPEITADLISTLAMTLGFVGRSGAAVTLLEARLGLTGAHYSEPMALVDRVRRATSGLAPGPAAASVEDLARALGLVGRSGEAVALLEAWLGLTDAHYSKPMAMGEHLRGATSGLAPDSAAALARILAISLGSVGRSDAAVSLLEARLGLTGADYADLLKLGKSLEEATSGLGPDAANGLIGTLADMLRSLGRSGAAISLLEARLGLTGAHYSEPMALVDRMRRATTGLGPSSSSMLLSTLAAVLESVGRPGAAVTLLEARLGLTDAHYRKPEDLGVHLRGATAVIAPDSAAAFVISLATVLNSVGRAVAAASLMEARLGLTDAHYREPRALGEHLRGATAGLAPDSAAALVITLATVFMSMYRYGEAVSLLEALLRLTDAHYRKTEDLGRYLREATAGLMPDNVTHLMRVLVQTLHEIGRNTEGDCLLDVYLAAFRPLDDATRLGHQNLVPLLDRWLCRFGIEDPRRAEETARKVVLYLRREIHRPGKTLDDRERLLDRIRGLRLTLGELARRWAGGAADAGEARRWHLTAQLWDAELGQRVLLERFLLGRVLHAGSDGAHEPAPRWPFAARESAVSDLPDELQTLSAFDALVGGGETRGDETGTSPLPVADSNASWLDEAKRQVSQGLDEPALAQALRRGTLLLRLSLSVFDGRFLWAATRSDGERLEVVAHGEGQPGDRSRLAWAVARHDLRIALAYLSPEVTRKLLVRLERAYGDGVLLMCDRDEGLLRDDTGDLVSQLKRDHEGFGSRFEAVCTPLMVTVPDLADQWRATLEALARTAGHTVRDLAPLNAATAEYLEEVRLVCDLGTLAEHLKPGLDVVVQADDVLHAVPVAHLEVAGRPLWERVRSVRASLSVLLDVLQRRIEQEHEIDLPSSRRLMTVSWVRPGDPARHATQRLHRDQRELASPSRFDLEWRGAAEEPAATPGTLFRGIDGGPLRALTVCGHGDERRAGVRLAGSGDGERLWSGQGRDLGGVEWLLLVSCSVGRVQGSSERDVEGLCVELALHRCRSVLAAKWPVEGVQAAAVAGRVLEEYLGLRRQFDDGLLGPDLSDARLRSLALNRARRRLGTDYLNTLAAFELYGLG